MGIVGHDLGRVQRLIGGDIENELRRRLGAARVEEVERQPVDRQRAALFADTLGRFHIADRPRRQLRPQPGVALAPCSRRQDRAEHIDRKSEEQTSEFQSLIRSRYAVFGLKKKINTTTSNIINTY